MDPGHLVRKHPIYRFHNGKIEFRIRRGTSWISLDDDEANYLLAGLDGMTLDAVTKVSLPPIAVPTVVSAIRSYRYGEVMKMELPTRIRPDSPTTRAVKESQRCTCLTLTGSPCLAPALKGKNVCRWHCDPK
jgi:hypothetical protein